MQRILGAAVVSAVMLATAGSAQAAFVEHPADFTYGTTKLEWVTSFTDEFRKPTSGAGNATWKEAVSGTIDFGEGAVSLEVPARPAVNTPVYQTIKARWTFPAPLTWGKNPPVKAKVRNCSRPVLVLAGIVYNLGNATCGAAYALDSVGNFRVLEPPAGGAGDLTVFNKFGVEDQPLTGVVAHWANVGSFHSLGTVRIDWGDGTTQTVDGRPSASPLVVYSGSSADVSVPHVYADGGTYTIRVGASSADCINGAFCMSTEVYTGARATATVTDTPRFRAAPITAIEGDQFNGRLGDVDMLCTGCTYSAQVDWGDGTKNAATITPVTSTFRTISGSHTWAGEGSYVVETTLRIDRDGSTIYRETKSSIARVDDAPLFATQDFEVAAPSGTSFTIGHMSDANPAAKPSDYIVQIAWGDGTTGAGTAVADPAGGFLIRGNHTYPSRSGFFDITYKVTSDRGASATGSASYSSGLD
jgi:hypothetical protein